MDPEKSEWFTIFRIIFDCTSAYSTIGLSLGTPNNNWSFCGEFGTASKLVVSLSFLLLLQVHLFRLTPLVPLSWTSLR
jgi:Trk-type K+ transport system membrane component